MRTKLQAIKEELRQRMHDPIPEQGKWLVQVVRGYFAYHAVPTNARSLGAFLHHVKHLWQRALRRRSQKDGTTWERIATLATEFLPTPRVLHPWPDERFLATHPRWKPSA
jgi:RNA-directed DNA polymerase